MSSITKQGEILEFYGGFDREKKNRVKTFVCNILTEEITENLVEKLDFCTMIFFLSSFFKKDLEKILMKIDKFLKNA